MDLLDAPDGYRDTSREKPDRIAKLEGLLQSKDARIAELEAELKRVEADYGGACQTIARMHEAAVGEIRGPIRGVWQDVDDLRKERDRLQAALDVVDANYKMLNAERDRLRKVLEKVEPYVGHAFQGGHHMDSAVPCPKCIIEEALKADK